MPKQDLRKIPDHLHEEINLVAQDNLRQAFSKHAGAVSFLKDIPEGKWSYQYAEGKWSTRGIVQNIIDVERIFCKRVLVIARKDKSLRRDV